MKGHSISVILFALALSLTTFAGCSESVAQKSSPAETRADNTANPSGDQTSGSPAKPRSRKFRFDYAFQLVDLPAGAKVRVWMPVPPSNRQQTVAELDRKLPAKATVAKETKYGNTILYLEPKTPASGQLDFRVSYRVERKEVRGRTAGSGETTIKPDARKRFLSPNANVPLSGKPLELLAGLTLPKEGVVLGRRLYDSVDDHLKYDKSKPGYGRGDVLWACDSRFGNCTDFHSLFISLARSQGLPARFEIGFPLPEKRGSGNISGYHCWAHFYVENHGWVPIDISEADKHPEKKDYYFGNLSDNRLTFTTGRDLVLVPRQAGKPLNYFVYPHVEVNGKPWPKEKVRMRFRFEDL
ncbi:MAG: transglutaminase domain-containing protein [Planctomycetes bacterium]|nr:transglutaminase domain-containing protein [Planctomycetota bacterium]